jgi:hypothetical protein
MITWPFKPRTSKTESLEWITNIVNCGTVEYRHSVRTVPRVIYKYDFRLPESDFASAQLLARQIGNDTALIPDWPNSQRIASISQGAVTLAVEPAMVPAYVALGKALVHESNGKYETVTISTVNAHSLTVSPTTVAYTKPFVAPLREGCFSSNFTGSMGPHSLIAGKADFRCELGDDLLSLAGTNDYPEFCDYLIAGGPIELINGVDRAIATAVTEFDSVTAGTVRYTRPLQAKADYALGFTTLTQSELWKLRCWLHAQCGRWRAFWLPSQHADLVVTSPIGIGGVTFEIASVGMATGAFTFPLIVRFVVPGMQYYCARVVSAAAGDPGRERLTVDYVFTQSNGVPVYSDVFLVALTPAAISSTQLVTLMRFAADTIDIQHLAVGQATVSLPVVEVEV